MELVSWRVNLLPNQQRYRRGFILLLLLIAGELCDSPSKLHYFLSSVFGHLSLRVMFPSMALCNLPRECRLVCTLYGKVQVDDAKVADTVQQDARTPLCWTALPLFNHNG